jgi:hypothetical protein
VEVTPTTATFTDDGGAGDGIIVEEPAEPESFDDLTETTEVAVAPEPDVELFTEGAGAAPETGGGVTSAPLTDSDPQAMSALPAAATPTIAPVLAQQLPAPPQVALVAAEVQSDPLDRVIQVVIALIMVGVVALIGFIGWTLVRQQ